MRIAFHDNGLTLRGTTVAIYDYAYYTRKYIGNDSIILYNKKHSGNAVDVIDKFSKEFPVFGYDNISQIDEILTREKCDYFFMEKSGKYDGIISKVCKNLIHAIGICNTNDKHGDIFAMGSEWLSKIVNYEIPFVPYIVDLPEIDENLRKDLGIPENHFVFGRNGGWETFDILWAKEAIKEALEIRSDIWFVFQFTEPFIKHERVVYLPGDPNLVNKVKFINTCDVMLHARQVGESFGLSCGEFSLRNKPIITYFGSPERNHIDVLDNKGIYFNNKEELLNILFKINKDFIREKNWNCYDIFNPVDVIKKFKEVYLK